MTFISDGFAVVDEVLSLPACAQAASLIVPGDAGSGGTRRLMEQRWCRGLAAGLRDHAGLSGIIPAGHVAVQCTFFEKSAQRNWLVALHQDLSIPVAARVDHPGLCGWSRKEDSWFVRAPLPVLEQLIAVRVHLDHCGPFDGALRVVPGSHRSGVLDDCAAQAVRAQHGEFICTVEQGAALVMRPLLLHASSKGSGDGRRRVLHFVFGPRELPYGLQWQVAV